MSHPPHEVPGSGGCSLARPPRDLREGSARPAAGELEKLAGIGRLAAGVAHEINNPLGVILGYAKLLEQRVDAEARDDLRVIQEEALRAKEIIEGLLDLSRPQEAKREPIDLRRTCDEIAERLGKTHVLDGVALKVDGAASTEGNPAKVRQVIYNLVRNAAEAAGSGGSVQVRIASEGAEARVAVFDSGPGLDERARARLFEPFYTTKERGTGLGLAISRAIARGYGGEIEVGSSPPGGALFTLRLPGADGSDPAPGQLAEAGAR